MFQMVYDGFSMAGWTSDGHNDLLFLAFVTRHGFKWLFFRSMVITAWFIQHGYK